RLLWDSSLLLDNKKLLREFGPLFESVRSLRESGPLKNKIISFRDSDYQEKIVRLLNFTQRLKSLVGQEEIAQALRLLDLTQRLKSLVGQEEIAQALRCPVGPGLRWGICSAGKISHDFTVALRTLPAEHHQVVAVAARDLSKAQEFAQTHKILRAYGSYEELARDPDIDVVYVGTIHPHHLQVSLLFMEHNKNILCEKPLAMNLREVNELLDGAWKSKVFLMEAVWTRFFPASLEISRLLSQNAVGKLKFFRAEFGVNLLGVSRSVKKDLGGGALLDIGIYCIQMALMVFDGERPESIQATGVLLDTGVDEAIVVTLRFSGQRLAVCTCTISAELPNEALIVGTSGTIKVPAHLWCPTSLIVSGVETQFPLPPPDLPLNFLNSTGMRYEAEEESRRMSHADSQLLAEIMDDARRQVGVIYDQDIAPAAALH
ncbi:hypothetical protein DNTS_033360, partial [Danionella cerebrum]